MKNFLKEKILEHFAYSEMRRKVQGFITTLFFFNSKSKEKLFVRFMEVFFFYVVTKWSQPLCKIQIFIFPEQGHKSMS